MSRLTKFCLMAAAICGIAGTAACILGLVLGADLSSQLSEMNGYNYENSAQEAAADYNSGDDEKIVLSDGEEVRDLEIDFSVVSLDIEASKDDKFYLENPNNIDIDWKNSSKTLKLEQNGDVEWQMQWEESDRALVLYVPEGYKFDQIDIQMDAGTIDVKTKLDCQELELDVDAGKVDYQGSAPRRGDITCNAGAVNMKLTGDPDSYRYDVESNVGSIDVNGTSYSGLNEKKTFGNDSGEAKFNLECNAGKIELSITQ